MRILKRKDVDKEMVLPIGDFQWWIKMPDCGSGTLLLEAPLVPNSTSASFRLLGLSGGDFSRRGARGTDTSCDRTEPGGPLQKGSTRSSRDLEFFGIGGSVS